MKLDFPTLRSHTLGDQRIIVANMTAGKTTRLIGLARDPANQRSGVLFFQPRMAMRTVVGVKSRIQAQYPETIPVSSLTQMARYILRSNALNIFFDEVQFAQTFREGPDAAFEMLAAVRRSGRNLFLSGLPVDFRGVPFPLMANLIAVPGQREFLEARCKKCERWGAEYPQRLEFGQPVPRFHPVFLPDTPKYNNAGITYEARCDTCYELPEDWNETSQLIHAALAQAKRRRR